MHNPKAGDAEHGRKQLMAALAEAGHHAIYQSTKERGFKKLSRNPLISCLLPVVTGLLQRSPAGSSIAVSH
jgi:hypothetical protein